jgi:hypothetical protein
MQISGTALVLDEIINHVQFLQRQVEVRVSSFLLYFGFGGRMLLSTAGCALY